MNKIFVGVDNGNDGAIVALDHTGSIIYQTRMPTVPDTKGKLVDERAICRIIKDLNMKGDVCVMLEEYTFARQFTALKKMADSFATIRTITHLLGLPFTSITPKEWQLYYFKKPKGSQDWCTKVAALKAARELWGKHDFRATERSKIAHDGIVDAALIAHRLYTINTK